MRRCVEVLDPLAVCIKLAKRRVRPPAEQSSIKHDDQPNIHAPTARRAMKLLPAAILSVSGC